MVGINNCAIPGCTYTRFRSSEKRAIFAILRPDLARNENERSYRQLLTKFILSMRDAKSGLDNISLLLQKERAGICEIHFKEEDIIHKGKIKALKSGAMPCKNLPKQSSSFQLSSRKAPTERIDIPKVYHRKLKDVLQSYEKLNPTLKEKWKIISSTTCLQIIRQEQNILIPRFKVTFNTDVIIETFELYGWRVQFSALQFTTLHATTLHDFLSKLENLPICHGVASNDIPQSVSHPILLWEGSKVIVRNTFHSLSCTIYCKDRESSQCSLCAKLEQSLCIDVRHSPVNDQNICNHSAVAEDDEQMPAMSNEMCNQKSDTETTVTVFCDDGDLLNSWQKLFLQEQKEHANMPPRRRRYHPDSLRWCIELYSRSPAAYQHLTTSGVLALPTRQTIDRYRNGISPQPGLNPSALDEISRVTSRCNDKKLQCYLTLDEMKIKENLVVKNGKLVGFVDYCDGANTAAALATHILVFYLRSSNHEISIPISWYPTSSTPSYRISLLFWEAVRECEIRGASILAVICDGHPSNRKFMKLISAGNNEDILHNHYTAPNPFAEDRDILLCSDPSHLLKTARNSLYSSKPGGTKYLHKNGRDILWSDITQLFTNQQSSMLAQQCRLTVDSVFLNSYSKMKVSLAKEVLSWGVGKCLELVPTSQGTAEYVLLFARWFEIMNCGMRNPVCSVEDERLRWLEDEFVTYLLDWKCEIESFHKRESKRIIALPTLEGLVFTSRNYVRLAKHLLCNGASKVCFKTFSQDVLEAFFGNVRSSGRRSTNPDIFQTAYAVDHITNRKVIKKVEGGNTTYGRKNPWTEVCEEPLSKRKR